VTRIRKFISSRPVLAVVLTAGLALVLGAGAGAAGPTGEVIDLEAEAADLREQLADAEGDSESAWTAAHAAESELEAAEAEASAAQNRVDELRGEAQSAEEPTAVSTAPTGSYEADGYVFSDVQITKDFVGDFEVQARVTNESGASGMRFIDASVFSGGSVVATADAIERIDAGETMTVELISTDNYDEGWDEVEFSVERW
jgi:uncharacterized protein involved in outer membrane biogenesis